jgi:hypothetical protein
MCVCASVRELEQQLLSTHGFLASLASLAYSPIFSLAIYLNDGRIVLFLCFPNTTLLSVLVFAPRD